MSQPRQHPALHEFFRWESQSWVEVVVDMKTDEKAYFMPVENLTSYFTANDSSTLNKITSEVFESDFPPIDPELILRDHTAIFCVLLHIGQGKFIEHFARYEELSDRRLPFDPNRPPIEFPVASDDPKFLQRFCEKQWMYCVPIFDDHMLHKHFGPQRLLPITYKEPRGVDGVASTYLIRLYPPYNKLLPAGQEMQMNSPDINTFLLKTYAASEGELQYREETNGFRSVRHTDSIVRFHGSYMHGDEFNILLEFADKGSLEEYFRTETPPSRGLDVIKFWESLFQLIKGLKAIHSVRERHHDVKPENVLVLSNGSESLSDWKFKFADFGLDNPRDVVSQDREAMGKDIQDAPTYGPPECYILYNHDNHVGRNFIKITWAADIWSLGCIYSEAAIWIADGYKGLVDYRRQRMDETAKVLSKGGGYFHDGERVLQSVFSAHIDIEDRLRRSDYITKDVLDSMVDEMLWEADRPNAKALWRKAEMISSKARQRLSSNSRDDFSQPHSSQIRSLQLPRHHPPTGPLPPIPRSQPLGLSPTADGQYSLNVETWRSQVTRSQVSPSQLSRPGSALATTNFPSHQISSTESVSDFDRELTGSIASWQLGDTNSVASPLTPFTSPRVSIQPDYHRHNPNEGRPRALQSRTSYEYRRAPKAMSREPSNVSNKELLDNFSAGPAPMEHLGSAQAAMTIIQPGENKRSDGTLDSYARNIDETTPLGRTASQAGSHNSSAYSIPIHAEQPEIPPRSQRRGVGFSLFPRKSREGSPPSPDTAHTIGSTFTRHDILSRSPETMRSIDHNFTHNDDDAVPRSIPPFSPSMDIAPIPLNPSPSMEYVSLTTCLEWKKAHKKAKRHSKVPPLHGARMLEELKDRDHVFIIDDSSSMSSVWPDMKLVFEALSYVVKGMSPDGTELYFTVSYDTYRRKDTSDLCMYLEKKETAGVTNISYRLNLQLQSYRAKLHAAKGRKGKKGVLRPMSFYILTNGVWGKGLDPAIAIKEMVDCLVAEKMSNGQVTIQFISFAQNPGAVQKLDVLDRSDFGVNIVDCTPWKGNVLKMLRGPLDKPSSAISAGRSGGPSESTSSGSTLVLAPATGSSELSELA